MYQAHYIHIFNPNYNSVVQILFTSFAKEEPGALNKSQIIYPELQRYEVLESRVTLWSEKENYQSYAEFKKQTRGS